MTYTKKSILFTAAIAALAVCAAITWGGTSEPLPPVQNAPPAVVAVPDPPKAAIQAAKIDRLGDPPAKPQLAERAKIGAPGRATQC